ncbi:hypothetical protein TruAng_001643 [Truncatella angustata]|nr:hypothetical protein TruAng_001643 [Truncatella angustata]
MALVHNNLGQNLLEGCCQEAARVQTVTRELEHLRMALPLQYHAHMILLIDGLQTTRHRLGDIIDSSQLYMIRVEVIIEYLNIVLPCLQRTLMDIERYYNDKTRSKINRWRAMYHEMGDELPGTTLPSRFIMYSQFLELLGLLLTKSPNFNMNTLYSLEHRIMQLREVRNIPPPSPIERPVLMWHDSVEFWEEQTNSHWAESIFTRLPPTHTILEEPKNPISQAFGPFQRLGQPLISPAAKILVKRSFNDEQLSVTFFLEGYDDIPHVFVRTVTGGQPWVSVLGAHNLVRINLNCLWLTHNLQDVPVLHLSHKFYDNLPILLEELSTNPVAQCISRHDNATLNLTRWSLNERRSKIWAALKFITYEALYMMTAFTTLYPCTRIPIRADADFMQPYTTETSKAAQSGQHSCLLGISTLISFANLIELTINAKGEEETLNSALPPRALPRAS